MDSTIITVVLGFIAVLISIGAGFTTIKRNMVEITRSVIEANVKIEHRFTVLETDLNWLKEHFPKRKTD